MTRFFMQLGDVPFEVSCLHTSTRDFCGEYLTREQPEFSVELTRQDLDRERQIARQQDARDGIAPQHYTDAYLETVALYRKLAEPMLARGGLIFHGAAVAVAGKSYLFTARSGTGKTTHLNLWKKEIPNSYILNGDKPLLFLRDDSIIVCGTPWRGKEDYGVNQCLPLRGLCLLQRGAKNHICGVSPAEAFPLLFQQAHHVASVDGMEQTMALLSRLAALVPLYRLSCNMDPTAARVSYEAMHRA